MIWENVRIFAPSKLYIECHAHQIWLIRLEIIDNNDHLYVLLCSIGFIYGMISNNYYDYETDLTILRKRGIPRSMVPSGIGFGGNFFPPSAGLQML